LIARDLFGADEHRVASKYDALMHSLSKLPVEIAEIELGKPDFQTWIEVLRNIQWWELNQAHGKWVSQNLDKFGEEIRGRLEKISSVTKDDMEEKRQVRKQLINYIENIIPPGTIAVFPTAPHVAPLKGRTINEARASRASIMRHTCIATVAGLPQVSMPLMEKEGCPVGISFLGASGQDGQLLAAAQVFGENLIY